MDFVSQRPKSKRNGLPIDAVDAEWIDPSDRREYDPEPRGDKGFMRQLLKSRRQNIESHRLVRKILDMEYLEGPSELDSLAYFRRLIKHYRRAARNAKEIGPRTGG